MNVRSVLALGLLGSVSVLGGCRKPAPEAPPPQERALPPLQVDGKGKWLYTYADESGRFITTDDAAAVPAGSRKMVRVTDPSRAASERRDGVSVYVIDLDELSARGKMEARTLSRQAFETGALAQLAPGESSPLPPADQAAPGDPGAPAAAGPPAAPGSPVVTLYGTSWCGVCKSARAYLREHHIPFADKDVEKDGAAARELAQKAARLGVRADRVPILDVRGRLLIGFDKDRLQAMLGESS
jgi:arsenate reductase-like glutaredoxin family protein